MADEMKWTVILIVGWLMMFGLGEMIDFSRETDHFSEVSAH